MAQPNQSVADELVKEDQFASDLGKSTRTIQRWRAQRTGPPFLKIGNQIFYRRSAVTEWFLSLEQAQPRAGRIA